MLHSVKQGGGEIRTIIIKNRSGRLPHDILRYLVPSAPQTRNYKLLPEDFR